VVASIASRGIRAHSADLWVYEIARGTLTRLTFDESSVQAIWTPDGRRIIIGSQTDRRVGIYWVPSDFSRSPELLIPGDGNDQRPQCWTPDGKSLLYMAGPSSKREMWLVSVPGGQPRRLLQGAGSILGARISPDGKWVAFESTESGGSEVYVQPFPGLGAKVQVSAGGGSSPRWRNDGGELYYGQPGVSPQDPARLMAAEIQIKSGFQVTRSRALFEIPAGATWDAAPDGKRFLVENATEASRNPKVTLRVVTDWFEELRRRVPAR
jgi:dipeptidyl aminopeptidase/acylaminoacyl peptidase